MKPENSVNVLAGCFVLKSKLNIALILHYLIIDFLVTFLIVGAGHLFNEIRFIAGTSKGGRESNGIGFLIYFKYLALTENCILDD
jgi:hypothetical protein